MPDHGRNQRYKDSYRGYLIDHHSPDPPLQPLDRLDVREWEERLLRGHVNCVLVYCKDHYGVTYYDTKVGRKHPGLKTDFIAEVAEMLARNGMEFWAYYSLGFDLWATQQHPEWAARDENGDILRVPNKWPFLCGNTGYRDYAEAQLAEMLAYKPDSLFLDIPSTPLCWCKACLARFRDRYGVELPRGDAKHREWRTMLDWYQEILQYEYLKDLTDHIHAVDPRVPVSMNGCHLHYTKRIQDLMDWTYAEPWAGNFVSAGFARGVGIDPQIGPGHLSQVYNPYPPSVYVAEIAGIAAQGVRPFLFSGSAKPDGSLDPLEFEEMGAAYAEVEKFEDLIKDRDAIKDVAILFSEQTRLFGHDSPRIRTDCWGCIEDGDYTEPIAGAVNAASVSKYPWEILPEWDLTPDELALHRVLVVPNATAMSDDQAHVITDWVRSGGALLATFKTGLRREDGEPRANFALADALGIDYVSINATYAGAQAYGSYLDNRQGPLWDGLPATCLAVAPPMVEVRVTTAEVLATHTLPACKETPDRWVNWWSPPPATPTRWPAVTLNRLGAGLAIYVGLDLFGMVRKSAGPPFVWPVDFLGAALVNVLLSKPRIQVKTAHPHSLDVTYAAKRNRQQVLVHLLNATVLALKGDVVTIPGAELIVRDVGFVPASAKVVYPERRTLSIEATSDGWRVALPDTQIHTIVQLEP